MRARWVVLVLTAAGVASGQTSSGLDTTTFVVMGEGLAAGMGNFGLSAALQQYSFPAQVAAQMNTGFEQPLMEPPGIGDVVGYPGQEVRLQTYPQGSVRQFYLYQNSQISVPPLFILNLSVPGLTLADSLTLQPSLPIAQRSMKQTVVNMILGFPQLFIDNVPIWTQFEYAQAMYPTMAMIELGYTEALDAAVNLDPTRLPDPNTFGSEYASIISGLRGLQAQVIATTIPNPLDTAYFSTPATAAQLVYLDPSVLAELYPQLGPQDYLTRNALTAISNQLEAGSLGPLPAGSVLPAATAAQLTAAINALNAQIISAAKANGAVVYDLNGFLHTVNTSGISAGGANLTSNFLGGFYTLDAVYPGPTANTLIANDFLTFLNSTYGRSFPLIDVTTVMPNDPVVSYARPAKIRIRTRDSLRREGVR